MPRKKPEIPPRLGRPPLPESLRKVNGSVRLTPERWAKLRRLGMDWLSRAVDRAKDPESDLEPKAKEGRRETDKE